MLKYMYITNDPRVAVIAENNGVDRIWIDLEQRGKEERQRCVDSVKSRHCFGDIDKVRAALKSSELIVRINPLCEMSSVEIDEAISRGAQYIMLPMFKSREDAARFIDMVGGRAKTILLLETKEAARDVDGICKLGGVDEIHIGLNDLHLSYGLDFMFELLINGEVERLCSSIAGYGIPYGFGGVARLNDGMLRAKHIIGEHYRLGSTRAILSRSFCNTQIIRDLAEIETSFETGMTEIRDHERFLETADAKYFDTNRSAVIAEVSSIVERIRKKKSEAI